MSLRPATRQGVMKKQKPTSSRLTILNQLCNLIPPHLVTKLARETGVDQRARTFSPWSHVVALLYAQLTHSLGLNDVCDALQLHSGPLSALRAARAPYKNTFSHANRTRDPKLGERLFYSMEHLGKLQPNVMCGWICKHSYPAALSSIVGRCRIAVVLGSFVLWLSPVKSSFSTRRIWIFPTWPICRCARFFGLLEPGTICAAA